MQAWPDAYLGRRLGHGAIWRYVQHIPHRAELVPGKMYILTHWVSVSDGVELDSRKLFRLDPPTAVHVVEVVRRDDLRRVRARTLIRSVHVIR